MSISGGQVGGVALQAYHRQIGTYPREQQRNHGASAVFGMPCVQLDKSKRGVLSGHGSNAASRDRWCA